MRSSKILLFMVLIAAWATPSFGEESTFGKETHSSWKSKPFIGIDAVKQETTLTYANGDELYEFEHVRLRLGYEHPAGGSAGIELLSGAKDDVLDPFGTPFELEVGEAFGIYATIGKPVYLRIGWATWETGYTNLTTDITDTYTVDSYDIGIGFNFSLGDRLTSRVTVYGEYSIRDTEADYPKHFVGTGDIDYESELVSLGFNILF